MMCYGDAACQPECHCQAEPDIVSCNVGSLDSHGRPGSVTRTRTVTVTRTRTAAAPPLAVTVTVLTVTAWQAARLPPGERLRLSLS
jgi:hypothetical protein